VVLKTWSVIGWLGAGGESEWWLLSCLGDACLEAKPTLVHGLRSIPLPLRNHLLPLVLALVFEFKDC